jgi:hypothetical protein
MKYRRLAAVAVFSAASAGFSAPVFSAPPPQGAFLRDDGNYWMHGPDHDYIIGPASAFSAPVTVNVRGAPPAPRREVVPVNRRGYTWAPGYWEYRHNRYQWVSGSWVRDRPGYYYSAPTWVQRGDHWVLIQGGWERGSRDRNAGDRDRDGIPDRYDGDRDNDGVPNRHDSRPDNPRRD